MPVRTIPQDLIGCQKRRKLKALIPRVVVFVNDPSSAKRRVDFAVVFIVLWSYGRKICLNMCHRIQKIHMVVHIFSGFAFFTESECIAELNLSASCWLLTRCLLIYHQTGANQNTALFSFRHARWNVIYKAKRKRAWSQVILFIFIVIGCGLHCTNKCMILTLWGFVPPKSV